MGLSSAVTWWEEWQLRILVLISLFIQYILFFSFWVRRITALRRFKVLVWIAYVSSDAVAIFALATLFNRHRQTCDAESNDLEVLWVPVLIIHLGGQPTISAYSLEDNELWKRHTITLVSQVTVALYVFCTWWSGEKMLLAAAVLLFILGILRFAMKPWTLRAASFNSLEASNTVTREEEPLREHIYSLEEYVQAAKKCVLDMKADGEDVYDPRSYYMFLDRSAPYSARIEVLTSFLKLEYMYAHHTLQWCLGNTFSDLYTKIGSMGPFLGIGSIVLLPFLALASVVIFAMSRKDSHNEKDIRVSYILICGTTVLDFILPFAALVPGCRSFSDKYLQGWHEMVSQHNIMSLCVRKKRPTFLMKLATFNFLRELVNQHWYIQEVPIAYQITGTVRRHVEDGWKKCIHDAASYKRLGEFRGQWALRMHHQLRWSMKMAFDESVLIWHVATNLCFYHPNTSPQCRQGEATQRSREISNYMFYLLLIRPEMLMNGTRLDLITLASDQIAKNNLESFDTTEEILAREILNKPMLPSADDMISNARKLAEALMELGGKGERWTMIQGVWVEMLCYSASRCRGYLHAKSLGEGGEYLSYIWLLWSFMGMETLPDRHHRSEPIQVDEEEEEPHFQGRVDQSAENFSPV